MVYLSFKQNLTKCHTNVGYIKRFGTLIYFKWGVDANQTIGKMVYFQVGSQLLVEKRDSVKTSSITIINNR